MSERNQQRRQAALKAWETRRENQGSDKALAEKLHRTADDMEIRSTSFNLYAHLVEAGKLSGRQVEVVKRFLKAFERLDERMANFYGQNQELLEQAVNEYFSR
jgi:hypothetical protein